MTGDLGPRGPNGSFAERFDPVPDCPRHNRLATEPCSGIDDYRIANDPPRLGKWKVYLLCELSSSLNTVPTTNTICAHCERKTVVTVPDGDSEIIGKSKEPFDSSDHWEPSTCDNCRRKFGIKFGRRVA